MSTAAPKAHSLAKNLDFTHHEKGTVFSRALAQLSLVVVAERSVVKARSHAAILEICVQIRTDTDLFFLASRIAPCQNEPLGKPRLTLDSEGNPLRRLLLFSK